MSGPGQAEADELRTLLADALVVDRLHTGLRRSPPCDLRWVVHLLRDAGDVGARARRLVRDEPTGPAARQVGVGVYLLMRAVVRSWVGGRSASVSAELVSSARRILCTAVAEL